MKYKHLKMFFNFEKFNKDNVSQMKVVIAMMLNEICELEKELKERKESPLSQKIATL